MGNTIRLIRDLTAVGEENRRNSTFGKGRSSSTMQYIMGSAKQVLERHNTRLELKSSYRTVRVQDGMETVVRCLVSLKSVDDELQQGKVLRYNNVDLICVIDVSGSMAGQKIRLVKKALEYVAQQLGEGDRMSLITFSGEAQVRSELCADYDFLINTINSLKADGSTNIRSGLKQAYKLINKNRQSASVQSVWLLSDGCDTTKFQSEMIEQHLHETINDRSTGPFTIHTIGFGNDHDSKLMKNIARVRGGKFIFIEKESELNQAMGNLLGGAFSTISHKAIIRVECAGSGAIREARITKAFGDYKSVPGGRGKRDFYEYEVYQYRAGSSNCYVFEVALPKAPHESHEQKIKGTYSILRVTAQLAKLDGGDPFRLEETLNIDVLGPTDVLRKELADEEVTENYTRVRVVQIMRECVELLELRRYEEVPELLSQAAPLLQEAPQTDKIKQLAQDVQEIRQRIQRKDYAGGYRYTCGQERYHAQRFYSVGQERFQSINLARHHVEFKERDWY